MSEDPARFTYLLVLLVLLGASFAARRVPLKESFRMLLAWIGIFAVLFVVFSFRGDFLRVWNRVQAEIAGTTTDANGDVRIRKGEDGHFTAEVTINGKTVQMLVDSGATTTTISDITARAAGVDVKDSPFPVPVDTANGTVMMKRSHIAGFAVGTLKREDFPVLVSDQDDLDILGMNFLSSLTSWRVEGDEMILVP